MGCCRRETNKGLLFTIECIQSFNRGTQLFIATEFPTLLPLVLDLNIGERRGFLIKDKERVCTSYRAVRVRVAVSPSVAGGMIKFYCKYIVLYSDAVRCTVQENQIEYTRN
jgi:hypothetical protein